MEKVLENMSRCLLVLLFSFIFFCLLINVFHQKEVMKSVFVDNDNTSLKEYSNVINTLEKNRNSYKSSAYDLRNDTLKAALKSCISLLKDKNGLYDNTGNLEAYNIYEINSFFENEIINKCWNDNMNFIRESNYKDGFLHNFPMYDNYVKKIINDTNYVRYELLNNSSMHYDSLNFDIRNNLQSEYEMIQNNYLAFSKIILDMSNLLVNGDTYE